VGGIEERMMSCRVMGRLMRMLMMLMMAMMVMDRRIDELMMGRET
jgi:hypothetical protein